MTTTLETSAAQFSVGDRVVDRSGFRGTVARITHFEQSRWYDIRFERGCSVRYDADLSLVN